MFLRIDFIFISDFFFNDSTLNYDVVANYVNCDIDRNSPNKMIVKHDNSNYRI